VLCYRVVCLIIRIETHFIGLTSSMPNTTQLAKVDFGKYSSRRITLWKDSILPSYWRSVIIFNISSVQHWFSNYAEICSMIYFFQMIICQTIIFILYCYVHLIRKWCMIWMTASIRMLNIVCQYMGVHMMSGTNWHGGQSSTTFTRTTYAGLYKCRAFCESYLLFVKGFVIL